MLGWLLCAALAFGVQAIPDQAKWQLAFDMAPAFVPAADEVDWAVEYEARFQRAPTPEQLAAFQATQPGFDASARRHAQWREHRDEQVLPVYQRLDSLQTLVVLGLVAVLAWSVLRWLLRRDSGRAPAPAEPEPRVEPASAEPAAAAGRDVLGAARDLSSLKQLYEEGLLGDAEYDAAVDQLRARLGAARR